MDTACGPLWSPSETFCKTRDTLLHIFPLQLALNSTVNWGSTSCDQLSALDQVVTKGPPDPRIPSSPDHHIRRYSRPPPQITSENVSQNQRNDIFLFGFVQVDRKRALKAIIVFPLPSNTHGWHWIHSLSKSGPYHRGGSTLLPFDPLTLALRWSPSSQNLGRTFIFSQTAKIQRRVVAGQEACTKPFLGTHQVSDCWSDRFNIGRISYKFIRFVEELCSWNKMFPSFEVNYLFTQN